MWEIFLNVVSLSTECTMFGDNNPTKRLTKVMQTALQVLTSAFFSQKALISFVHENKHSLMCFYGSVFCHPSHKPMKLACKHDRKTAVHFPFLIFPILIFLQYAICDILCVLECLSSYGWTSTAVAYMFAMSDQPE